jgi:hypothetical protein
MNFLKKKKETVQKGIQSGKNKLSSFASKTQKNLGWDEASCNKKIEDHDVQFCQKTRFNNYSIVEEGTKEACEKNLGLDKYCYKFHNNNYVRSKYKDIKQCNTLNKNKINDRCLYKITTRNDTNLNNKIYLIPKNDWCQIDTYAFPSKNMCESCIKKNKKNNKQCTKDHVYDIWYASDMYDEDTCKKKIKECKQTFPATCPRKCIQDDNNKKYYMSNEKEIYYK